MSNGRGRWLHYDGAGIPCDPALYVDVCEGDDVYIDIPAHQAFDPYVTHWRLSVDNANRRVATPHQHGAGNGEKHGG